MNPRLVEATDVIIAVFDKQKNPYPGDIARALEAAGFLAPPPKIDNKEAIFSIRDKQWCEALIAMLDVKDMERVLVHFNHHTRVD